MAKSFSKKRHVGRPRKTLVGGHTTRVVPPTEDARLKAVLRTMSTPVAKKKSAHPAPKTFRRKREGNKGPQEVLIKGHHQGRPEGSKNKVPSGIRASVRSVLERVVKEKSTTIEQAIVDGLSSGPRHADRYLRLAAEYVDGKPTDHVSLNARFNTDELSMAKEQLGKKLGGILSILLKAPSDASE